MSDADQPVRVAVFDSKPYSKAIFLERNKSRYEFTFYEHRLNLDTAGSAVGFPVVCPFVNDTLDAPVIARLAGAGVRLIAMRCAGYNNVDLAAAHEAGISVVRVPAYSPHSVAEHSVALMMTLNRKIHRAYNRVREGNFSLTGLVGFEMHGKTVGVVGTGRIGCCAIEILLGFGCRVLAFDPNPREELIQCGVQYMALDELLPQSDIVSLYVPLMPQTYHLIGARSISRMKPGAMLINTSRGGLVDTVALVDALKTGHIGSAGLDVYEEEGDYFFEDCSNALITDDTLARLLTFNNVIVTSHQAFLTQEALTNIVDTTLENIREYESGRRAKELTNGVCVKCSS